MKFCILSLIFFVCLYSIEIYARHNHGKGAVKTQEASVFTITDTYLASPRGEIIADLGVLLSMERDKKSSLLLFGTFKKFGSFPQEVVQVIWREVGLETKKNLKKERFFEKIQSSFRYGDSVLPKRTKLKIKGDLTGLLSKAEMLLRDDIIHSGILPEKKQSARFQEDSSKSPKGKSNLSDKESSFSSKIHELTKEDQKREPYREKKAGSRPPFFLSSRVREGLTVQSLVPGKKEKKEQRSSEKKEQMISIPDSVEIEILKEGCTPRIDDIQGMVIIQTRANTLKNGEIIKRGVCSDSSERYPIKRQYDGCADKVSKEQGFAWAQYKRYWTDGAGDVYEIDRACRVDEDLFFEILEQEKACTLSVNLKDLTALRMAELYYKDRKAHHITLEECRPLKGEPPLKLEKVFCGYVHDFERGLSFPQTRIIALVKGKELRITPCSDDGEGIAHQISSMGCNPLIDPESGKRFAQVRTLIETPQGPLLITGCRPSQELQETSAGCETKFDHDLDLGKSRGYTRFFHTIQDNKTYVTDCLPSQVTFPHQIRIKGYEHFDDLKSSKPKTEIYIDVSYAGSILVDEARLRSDTSFIPYHPKEIRQKRDEPKARFEGCFKITPLKRTQVYERPDHSLYEEFVGEGIPERSHNLCKLSEETQEYKSSSWVWSFHGKPFTDVWHPGGSVAGVWVSCPEASSRISLRRGDGWSFFLYHYSQLQKRTKTEFPSGQVQFTPWQVLGAPQKVKEQTCHYG